MMQETLSTGFANNEGADQPAHPQPAHPLISIFVIRYISIVVKLDPYKISKILLVSVAEKTGLSLTSSETPETGFLAPRLI